VRENAGYLVASRRSDIIATAKARRSFMKPIVTVVLLWIFSSACLADTMFRCHMNAVASRDFQTFGDHAWCGSFEDCGSAASFETKLFDRPSFEDLSYREHVLSLDPDSKSVAVKSYWARDEHGKPLSEEFSAPIVSREGNVVFFIFKNPAGNKLHSYALDLKHKKLVTASLMDGATSLVTQATTFDCE
jgi:hypothetical protein